MKRGHNSRRRVHGGGGSSRSASSDVSDRRRKYHRLREKSRVSRCKCRGDRRSSSSSCSSAPCHSRSTSSSLSSSSGRRRKHHGHHHRRRWQPRRRHRRRSHSRRRHRTRSGTSLRHAIRPHNREANNSRFRKSKDLDQICVQRPPTNEIERCRTDRPCKTHFDSNSSKDLVPPSIAGITAPFNQQQSAIIINELRRRPYRVRLVKLPFVTRQSPPPLKYDPEFMEIMASNLRNPTKNNKHLTFDEKLRKISQAESKVKPTVQRLYETKQITKDAYKNILKDVVDIIGYEVDTYSDHYISKIIDVHLRLYKS